MMMNRRQEECLVAMMELNNTLNRTLKEMPHGPGFIKNDTPGPEITGWFWYERTQEGNISALIREAMCEAADNIKDNDEEEMLMAIKWLKDINGIASTFLDEFGFNK